MSKGLKKVLGKVAPVALSFFAPGIGTALGAALGATGTAATALGQGLIGAGIGGLTGGGKGALLGGIGGYLSPYSQSIGQALGASGSTAGALGQGLIGAGIGGLSGGGSGALFGGLSGGLAGYLNNGGKLSDIFSSASPEAVGNITNNQSYIAGNNNTGGYSNYFEGINPQGQQVSGYLPEGSYIKGNAVYSGNSPFGYDLGSSGYNYEGYNPNYISGTSGSYYDTSGLNFNPNSILGGGTGSSPLSDLFSGSGSGGLLSGVGNLLGGLTGTGSGNQSFLGGLGNIVGGLSSILGGGQNSNLGGLLSALQSGYQTYKGYDTANDVARAQLAAQNRALDIQKQQYDQARQDFSPFRESGTAATNRLSQLLGIGGDSGSNDYGSLLKPFSLANFQQDPGYQFRLDQGNKAIERAQAARGNFYSGGALKEINDYNSGLASQEYQNAYNRYNTDNSNIYNRLAGVINTGIGATNQGVASGQNYANQVSGLQQGFGQIQGQRELNQQDALNRGLGSFIGSRSQYRLPYNGLYQYPYY